MLAVVAAILLGLALLFDLLKTNLGGTITVGVLELAGLFFLACHFASTHGWSKRSYRR
jgi:membrane protein CcdC involved in cytochrome C biogenesis